MSIQPLCSNVGDLAHPAKRVQYVRPFFVSQLPGAQQLGAIHRDTDQARSIFDRPTDEAPPASG
jgi:hypothetical protein